MIKSITAGENENGELDFEIEIEYDDPKTKVHIATTVSVNYPVKNFVLFPLQFCLEDIYFRAKVNDFYELD